MAKKKQVEEVKEKPKEIKEAIVKEKPKEIKEAIVNLGNLIIKVEIDVKNKTALAIVEEV